VHTRAEIERAREIDREREGVKGGRCTHKCSDIREGFLAPLIVIGQLVMRIKLQAVSLRLSQILKRQRPSVFTT
jgi:hypothetical protein